MRLAVFIKFGQRPIVVKAHEASQQQQAAGSGSSAASSKAVWNSKEFCRIVQEGLLGHRSNRAGRRHLPIKLLLDRDPAHLNSVFKDFAHKNAAKVLFLPAKAPDLDPLDYGVFGEAKQAWDKLCFNARQREQLSWEQQCQLLIQMLEQVDPSPHIAALPSRISRCIAAGGGHFER